VPGLDDAGIVVLGLAFAVLFAAGLVHGALGLGFPLVATPLLALMTDVRSAIVITLLPTIAVNVISIVKGGRWGESIGHFWPMAVYAAAGSIIGSSLLVALDPSPFRLLLAAAIVLYLNAESLGGRRLAVIARHPRLSMAAFGLVGGFLAGTVNVMAPLLIIFALEMGLAATAMVQVFNLCFLAGKLSQTGVFTHAGIMHLEAAATALPAVATAVMALLLGMALRSRIRSEQYRRILRKVLALLAAVLVVQFASGLAG